MSLRVYHYVGHFIKCETPLTDKPWGKDHVFPVHDVKQNDKTYTVFLPNRRKPGCILLTQVDDTKITSMNEALITEFLDVFDKETVDEIRTMYQDVSCGWGIVSYAM